MSAARVPIEKHPGFWRRGDRVTFKYRDHRRRQRWASAATIAAAKKLKAQLETDVARGEYRDRTEQPFEDYARAWVGTYQGRTSRRITESTRDDYRRRLEQEAIPFFGRTPLSSVTPQDIKEYAAHVARRSRRRVRRGPDGRPVVDARPISDSTVRLALAPVKALFATAFEEGAIRVNPAAGVRVLVARDVVVDVDDGAVKALTEEQLVAVLGKLPDRWRLFFLVLAHLGLRIGEAIELRWRDVDLGARTVAVRRTFYDGRVGRPKSKYGRRTLRLTPELARALWGLRKETRALDSDLVFTAPQGGRISATNLMARVLKPAARAAGVGEWVGFHTFRHTCATLLFTRGEWNPKQVQVWLGHHSPAFTLATYIHLLPSDLPEPVSLVPAAPAARLVGDGDAAELGDPVPAGASARAGSE